MDFRNISCFTSKNILWKTILKYHVSMLTGPTCVYSKICFRIIRAVKTLSQLYMNRKFQKYVSVSFCHCHRVSFMNSLFIAYKNDEWCHFVVRIGSPFLTSFYCICFICFYASLFSFCGVYFLLRYWGKLVNTHNKAVRLFLVS